MYPLKTYHWYPLKTYHFHSKPMGWAKKASWVIIVFDDHEHILSKATSDTPTPPPNAEALSLVGPTRHRGHVMRVRGARLCHGGLA
jgi:hypothetical protein